MNRNTHYILILGRKYEEFFVVLLSFLHNAIYSINSIHSVVTLFKGTFTRYDLSGRFLQIVCARSLPCRDLNV